MHMTDRKDSCKYIRFCFRVRLMEHPFVSLSCSTRFIRIDPGHKHKAVSNLFLHLCQTVRIFAYGVFIVGRTGPHDHEKLIGFSCDHITDKSVATGFYFFHFFGHRLQCFDLVRRRQLSDKCKTHCIFPL